MKRTLLLILLSLQVVSLVAQNSVLVSTPSSPGQIETTIESLFSEIDLSGAATGYFKEWGIERIDFGAFNGSDTTTFMANAVMISEIEKSFESMDVSGTRL